MKKQNRWLLVLLFTPLLLGFSLFASGKDSAAASTPSLRTGVPTENFSLKNDIAFVSVWGSRPETNRLQGFERAVLYNARGEVVQKLNFGRDSIYSLDKMIKENQSRGPLVIRMYRK
jgi:hypothetical protein